MSEDSPLRETGSHTMDSLPSSRPEVLLSNLYRLYETRLSAYTWPWENLRWDELVFCFLVTIGEPEVSPATCRELIRTFADWHLLEIKVLAGLRPSEPKEPVGHPLWVTMDTLLQRAGFAAEKSSLALTSICEAAYSLVERYEGKIQGYLRRHGMAMLDQLTEDYSFSQIDDAVARRAFAVWFQNTLNMPVPASDPVADRACEQLGVHYDDLVHAADASDVNVALLDDVLRFYWEDYSADQEARRAME